jgi:hypothetical protein
MTVVFCSLPVGKEVRGPPCRHYVTLVQAVAEGPKVPVGVALTMQLPDPNILAAVMHLLAPLAGVGAEVTLVGVQEMVGEQDLRTCAT